MINLARINASRWRIFWKISSRLDVALFSACASATLAVISVTSAAGGRNRGLGFLLLSGGRRARSCSSPSSCSPS
jgi:hypothetical protein